MRRIAVVASVITVTMGSATLAGCQRDTTNPAAAALINEPFFISGAITEAGQPWGFRIKGEPGTSYKINEAYFKVAPATEFRRADGGAATVSDLTVGREISLWITGPIAESYPVQVTAKLVVVK